MNLTASLFDIRAIYAKCNEEARAEIRMVFGAGHFNDYPKILHLSKGSGIGMSKLHYGFFITSIDTGKNVISVGDTVEWSDNGGVVLRFRDDYKGYIYIDLVDSPYSSHDVMMLEKKGLTIKNKANE